MNGYIVKGSHSAIFTLALGGLVAQWIRHWPVDLAVLGLSSPPPSGENLFNHKQGFIAHSLSLSSTHHPDITKVLMKRT